MGILSLLWNPGTKARCTPRLPCQLKLFRIFSEAYSPSLSTTALAPLLWATCVTREPMWNTSAGHQTLSFPSQFTAPGGK